MEIKIYETYITQFLILMAKLINIKLNDLAFCIGLQFAKFVIGVMLTCV